MIDKFWGKWQLWPKNVTTQLLLRLYYFISTLVASQKNPNIFWTLNDSGNQPCVFAISHHGTLKYKLCLDGAQNIDWEAIATAPCTKG